MSSVATSSSSASSSFFAATASKSRSANSYSDANTAVQTDDSQDQNFEKVLDNHVQQKNSGRRSSSRTQESSQKEVSDTDSTEQTASSKIEADAALLVAMNAVTASVPTTDPDASEIAVLPQIIGEDGKAVAQDKIDESIIGGEAKAEDLLIASEAQMGVSPNEDTTPKTASPTNQTSKFQKTFAKAQDLVGAGESSLTSEASEDFTKIESSSSETYPSGETSFIWQSFTQQMEGDSTSNWEASNKDAADSSVKNEGNSATPAGNPSFATHASSSKTFSTDIHTETLAKEPVQQSTALKLISEAANTQNTALPRRLEVSLQTPEGAVVHVYLQESNGGVRAQLSTNDSDTLKWLHQQIPALKEMQNSDSSVRWLPPQMESQNQYGQQRGSSFNQQNQQGDEGTQQNPQNQTKNEVLDFAKILEKPL